MSKNRNICLQKSLFLNFMKQLYTMITFDETDATIIDVLKKNARLSTREIGKKSGIPAATVYKRMKKMEKNGIIERYTVVLDKEKLGKETVAYVLVRTKPGANYTEMMKDITKHEEVEDIAAIAGEFDILLKLRTKSINDLDAFIFNYLRRFPDITQTQTLIVFRGGKSK